MSVKIKGELYYLWRAGDHKEKCPSFVTKTPDKKAALKLLKKTLKCYGGAA